MELPDFIKELNKKKEAVKVTTLTEAKAFKLKRFWSGSFGTDFITGGGFAYRRIQLLFGAKSAGKNALLNQTTAYLQRQCRVCHGVNPDYLDDKNNPKDYWTFMLRDILGFPMCKCKIPIPKSVFILDYERALAIEEPRDVKIRFITNKKTGEDIDELDYNDVLAHIEEFKAKAQMTEEDKKLMKKDEEFLKNISISEKVVEQIAITNYLKKCGVNPDELLVADPEDTEEGIEMVREAIKSKEVDAIIWDSLQAAIPKFVKDRDSDEPTMGVEAKQNGLLMRYVCSAFAAIDLTDETEAYKPGLFITSQVRSTLGGFVSRPDTYSGGNAIQHHIALALELKRNKFLKEDGKEASFTNDFYGQNIRLRADKNKLSAPGDMHEFDYFFREGGTFPIGIDSVGELINVAAKVGTIVQTGSWYTIGDDKFQGKEHLKKHLREHPELVRNVYVKTLNRA